MTSIAIPHYGSLTDINGGMFFRILVTWQLMKHQELADRLTVSHDGSKSLVIEDQLWEPWTNFCVDNVSMDGYLITNVTIRSMKLFAAIWEQNHKHPTCSEKVLLGVIKRFEETAVPNLEIP